MFSKSFSALLLTLCLFQPNEAIFGLDGVIGGIAANWAIAANNSTLKQTAQSIAILLAQQTTQQALMSNDFMNKLNSTITDFKNNLTITYNISTSNRNYCFGLHTSSFYNVSVNIANNFANVCKPSIADAMLIAGNISLASQNLTNSIVNFNNTFATACPPPAAGDFIGGILWRLSHPLCFKNAAAGVFSAGFGIADNQNKLNNLIQNPPSLNYTTCQANFLASNQMQPLQLIMESLKGCFLFAFG